VSRISLTLEGVQPLTVRTADGLTLRGLHLPADRPVPLRPGERALTFVVAHGFTNGAAKPASLRVARGLSRFGEVADLDAAVAAARSEGADAVVTVGFSMGGGVALRQAGLGTHRPDAVVSVSAVARWYVRETRPMRRVHWLLETTPGRLLAAPLLGLRLGVPWDPLPVSPIEAAHLIAPTPLLLVHGDRDEYFPVEHFAALARAAGPTATAIVIPGFGHAENGVTAPLVERIGRWASATIHP
jgi:dienelactone hydrolase